MNKNMFGGLTLKELGSRVWRESNEDNVFGGGAELAYYFLLALFPMLIFLTSLVGFMPGLQDHILSVLSQVAPGDAMRLVRETLQDVTANSNGGLLSFGVLGTIWAASNGVSSLMGTLNIAYDAKEERSFWKMRAIAVGLTVALALLLVGGTVLIMFGDKFAEWFAAKLGISAAVALAWKVVDYVLGLALIFAGIQILYYFGPNVKQEWKWITPGAVFAVAGIILGSLGFSLYLRFGPSYSATYGSLGAVIILMLWLYLIGIVLLIGGEINSEIEHASGKPTVEKGKKDHLQAA